MTSRKRVQAALNHRQPDYVPLDLGASAVTGMHVNAVYALRQALALDAPGTPVKVVEPYQMLGEIAPDLQEALGIDVVGVGGPRGFFGWENAGWKAWTTFQGTPVLVPEAFNTSPEPNGDLLQYPEGDRSAPASGRMPRDGWYHDSIIRQEPIDDANLDPMDNLQEFGPITDADLAHFRNRVKEIRAVGDKAILANFGGTAFGDIALVPAPWLKHPRGIRDIAEWYMSTVARFDYVYEVFEMQCEIALANLAKIYAVVGDEVDAVFLTGTDFGTQHGAFISCNAYSALYQPFHKIVNDWVHEHTKWKTFIHSCGSVRALVPFFIESGFDILNPVQCSAANMDAAELKREFGDRIVFWGGGVDTQKTLPFGMPDDVRREVRERIDIFGSGGGFVFNTVHNVQSGAPAENLVAMYETVRACRGGNS
jgi:hypothetical protein